MKRVIFSFATLLAIAAVFAFTAAAQGWQIKTNYNVQFSNPGVSGIFKTLKGDIAFDEKNLGASKFDMNIEVASINTGNGLQNKHAKGSDWFEADKFPLIKFTSSRITKNGNNYLATGTLEMHGQKKEIGIPFTFAQKGNEGTFAGAFTVNRNDFKIGKPGGDVDDMVKIELSVPVTKK